MPLVSIVVPIYKVKEKYLRTCIESLQQQTLNDIEIILVDDGTTTECKELCKYYAERDDRIQLYQQSNQGVSVARNQGINVSSSPIITFVDSDDWVEPEMCDSIYREFQNNSDIEIFIFAAYLNDRAIERKNPFWNISPKIFEGDEKKQLQLQSIYRKASEFVPEFSTVGTTWCKAYKRQWLLEKQLYYEPELRRGQDTIFNLYAFEKAEKILYVEKYLYHYRINAFSAIHKYTEGVIVYMTRIQEYMLEFIKNYEKTEEFYQAYYNKCVSLLITAMGNDYFHENNPKPFKKKKEELRKAIDIKIYREALEKVDDSSVPFRRKVFWRLIKNKAVNFLFLSNKLYKYLVRWGIIK
jgi:glycosyltransferase EpsH